MPKSTHTLAVDGKEVWLNTVKINGKFIIEDGGVNLK